MRPLARYLLIGIVAAAAATAGFLTRQEAVPDEPGVAAGASAAPLLALTLPDLDGTPQPLAQWHGKVIVLNFWATWCPPCLQEIPDFAVVSARYAQAPVQFVGIGIDRVDNMRAFQDEMKVPYPLLVGTAQTLSVAAAIAQTAQALPLTIIIDREGAIHRIKLGTLNQAELEGTIRALLAP